MGSSSRFSPAGASVDRSGSSVASYAATSNSLCCGGVAIQQAHAETPDLAPGSGCSTVQQERFHSKCSSIEPVAHEALCRHAAGGASHCGPCSGGAVNDFTSPGHFMLAASSTVSVGVRARSRVSMASPRWRNGGGARRRYAEDFSRRQVRLATARSSTPRPSCPAPCRRRG